MSANLEHDDYGRPWGVPLWDGGPVNGGENWREFVPKMLEHRRVAAQGIRGQAGSGFTMKRDEQAGSGAV